MNELDPITNVDDLVSRARAEQSTDGAKYAAIDPQKFAHAYGRVLYWSLLVQPLPPTMKVGSIITVEETQRNEEYLTTIGRIIAIGAAAFKGKTASGISLDENLKVGDWVLYGKYTGQQIKLANGQRIVALSDSDLLMHIKDPNLFRTF